MLNTAKRAYADISYKFKDDDEASEGVGAPGLPFRCPAASPCFFFGAVFAQTKRTTPTRRSCWPRKVRGLSVGFPVMAFPEPTFARVFFFSSFPHGAGLDTGRRARHDAASAEMSNEEKRRLHQEELAAKLDLQARARLLAQASNGGDGEKRDEIAFKRAEHIPEEEASKLKIFIAKKQQAVILPIYGMAVPYHISHIKNISKTDENDYTYLRINFVTQPHLAPAMVRHTRRDGRAGVPFFRFFRPDPSSPAPPFLRGWQPEGAIFVKELVYKSRSPVGLNNAFRLIKELQRQYKTREAEVKELKNFVEQEELVLNRSKNQIRINDLFIRPTLGASWPPTQSTAKQGPPRSQARALVWVDLRQETRSGCPRGPRQRLSVHDAPQREGDDQLQPHQARVLPGGRLLGKAGCLGPAPTFPSLTPVWTAAVRGRGRDSLPLPPQARHHDRQEAVCGHPVLRGSGRDLDGPQQAQGARV